MSSGAREGTPWTAYYIGNSAYAAAKAAIHDFTRNVALELYSSRQNSNRDQAGTALHFTIPTVADGRVYVPASRELDIYGLLDAKPHLRQYK